MPPSYLFDATQTSRILAVLGKPVPYPCDECGSSTMVVRRSRYNDNGYFLGCSNFPECHHTVDLDAGVYRRAFAIDRHTVQRERRVP